MWWPWRSGQDSRRVCGSRPIDRTKGESGKTGVCWRAEPPGSRAERDLRPSPKAGAKRGGGATRRFGAMRVARRASALTELSCLAVSGRRPASPAREDGSRRARQPGLDRNPPLPLPGRTCQPAIRPCPEKRLGYQGKPLPAGRDGNAATRLKRGDALPPTLHQGDTVGRRLPGETGPISLQHKGIRLLSLRGAPSPFREAAGSSYKARLGDPSPTADVACPLRGPVVRPQSEA